MLVPAALLGLPVSLIYCFVLGELAWSLAIRCGLARRRHFVAVGAGLGVVFYGLCEIVVGGGPALGPLPPWMPQRTFADLYTLLYVAAVGALGALSALRAAASVDTPDGET